MTRNRQVKVWDGIEDLGDLDENYVYDFKRSVVIRMLTELDDDLNYGESPRTYSTMSNEKLEEHFCSAGFVHDDYMNKVIDDQPVELKSSSVKLTSEKIKQVVIEYAVKHVPDRWDPPWSRHRWTPEDQAAFDEAIKSASNAKKWKRRHKSKVGSGFYEDQTFDEVVEDIMGNDNIDVFDNQKITKDCIMRHFVNDDLEDELDPIVVTDPKDEKILLISWHSD